MRKGTLLAVSVGTLVLAVGLGLALSQQQGPLALTLRPARATGSRPSTGFLLPAPTPRPSGSLPIRGIVLGESGPLGGGASPPHGKKGPSATTQDKSKQNPSKHSRALVERQEASEPRRKHNSWSKEGTYPLGTLDPILFSELVRALEGLRPC